MKEWGFLLIAIVSEVVATAALKPAAGFTQLLPSLVVLVGYAASFYFLSLTLKAIPIGVMYAVWSGLGIILLVLIGRFWFGQSLDMPTLLGVGLILVGVMILNLYGDIRLEHATDEHHVEQ